MKNKTIRRLITVGLILIMVLVFAFTTEYFLSLRNISQMLREAAYTGLLAVGMSFVMIGGGIDLSLGGIVCATSIICARISLSGMNGYTVLVCGILFGCLLGLINATLVTRLHMTEFVATLASGLVYSGLGLLLAFREGNTIVTKPLVSKTFLAFGKTIGGFYYMTIVWVVVAIIAFLVMTRTVYGRHTYAVGSNARAAEMSGINNRRIKTTGFIIAGGIAGLTAFLMTAFQGSSTVAMGSGMEFQAIAACVVGGIAMSGGRGDAISAVLGAIFLALIKNGLNKFGLSTAWQYVYMGAIIILATAFDAWFRSFASERRKSRMEKDFAKLAADSQEGVKADG
ncbi:MAG: ABC transporter permease [Oscillospiraceae bacterium]|nr:ABC transporter permease [Oscillospiraceae bacterium]